LRELYDRDALTLAGYDALGGVAGALALRADSVLDRLTRDGHAEAVIPALLRLASVDAQDEPVRRPVARDAVPLAEQPVLDAFAEARLLTIKRAERGETTIEVAHEALLRAWPPLRDAIAASSERLRIEAELARDAEEWSEVRDRSYLLHGERLARARLLVNSPGSGGVETLGAGAREFYLASEALERRERRGRRIRWSVVTLRVLALSEWLPRNRSLESEVR
jgi:Novel STAND NTPase 1